MQPLEMVSAIVSLSGDVASSFFKFAPACLIVLGFTLALTLPLHNFCQLSSILDLQVSSRLFPCYGGKGAVSRIDNPLLFQRFDFFSKFLIDFFL